MKRAALPRPSSFLTLEMTQLIVRATRLCIPLFIAVLIALAWLVYHPGLKGSFLFDDFANLPALGAEGPVHSAAALVRYLTSGKADPTGRPLSLLSFLVDARNWPASPWPFKRTNLVIHIINGLLLYALIGRLMNARLGDISANRRQLQWRLPAACAVAAGMWLLHPLFVSTTLYIVQREAMLACAFVMLGLIAWLRGRQHLLHGQRSTGLAWMVFGLTGCTALAMLCKANGALLPALAMTLEGVWLAGTTEDPDSYTASSQASYRKAYRALVLLPTLLLAAYLLYEGWHGITHGISSTRPWTLTQRLLTEPRILLDYLRLLWVPQLYTPGLFNDQIQASSSLLHPATTLLALIAIIALITTAWFWRRRAPALATAVLFFFVGQAMESSTLGLELYFEHRNYLPAIMMFWPLALWLCGLNQDATSPAKASGKDWQVLKACLAIGLILGLGWMCRQRASLWGNTAEQSLLWARLNPDSPRAQAMAAGTEIGLGRPESARRRMLTALRRHPDELQLAFNLADAECAEGILRSDGSNAMRKAITATTNPGVLMTQGLDEAIDRATSGTCKGLDLAMVDDWLKAAATNSAVTQPAGRRQDWLYLRGRVALARGRADEALQWFDQALDAQVRPGAALRQAALLGEHGFPSQGLHHLDHYSTVANQAQPPPFGMPRVHAWVLEEQGYWTRDLAHLRATLRDHLPPPRPAT